MCGAAPWIGGLSRQSVRPFFGFRLGKGGPAVRTSRMKAHFGNYFFAPNLIYASSAGLVGLSAIKKARSHAKIILNQNGVYYPGWYFAQDLAQKNQQLALLQALSDEVIFQSEFCKQAYLAHVGPITKPHRVVLNSCPDLLPMGASLDQIMSQKAALRPCAILSGVFSEDAPHILEPLLDALEILAHENFVFKVILAGYFDSKSKQMEWYSALLTRIQSFEKHGMLEWIGTYDEADLVRLSLSCHFALHLKYKDPCPNAVIERMSLGLPHIFSNSGGTPELVGGAGIGLRVPDSWSEQCKVNAQELAQAIKQMSLSYPALSVLSRSRYVESLSWTQYLKTHDEIFNEVLVIK